MKNEKMWITIAICALVGIFMLGSGVFNYFALKKAPNLYEMNIDKLKKNEMVRGTAEFVYDYYCYETNDGIETYRWYLVPIFQGENDARYLTVKVHKDLFNSYDQLCDATWDYLDGKSDMPNFGMNFQGRLKTIKGDVKEQLDRYIEESGEYADEWREAIIPYCLELVTTKGSIRSMIAGGIALAIGLALFLVVVIRDRKENAYIHHLQQGRITTSLNPPTFIDDRELDNLMNGDAVSKQDEPFTPYDPYAQTNFTNDATNNVNTDADDAQVLSEEDYTENATEESDNEEFDNNDSNNGNWVL